MAKNEAGKVWWSEGTVGRGRLSRTRQRAGLVIFFPLGGSPERCDDDFPFPVPEAVNDLEP